MRISIKLQKIFLVFVALALIPSMAQALSLGTLQKNSFAELEKGKTAEFTILFWNLENFSSLIKLESKVPEGFVVIILPNEFVLNQSKLGPPYDDGEYVQTAVGDVKAFPVKVLIKALENVEKGNYEIPIVVRAEGFGTGIKFAQEKTFMFSVSVNGFEKQETIKPQGQINKTEESNFTGVPSLPQTDKHVFLIVSIIIILLVSFLVYKLA